MGKLFGGRATLLGYELSKGRIFQNQKNLVSIQVQMFIFLIFLQVPAGRTEQCSGLHVARGLQFAHSCSTRMDLALNNPRRLISH